MGPGSLTKQPGESRLYSMDFSGLLGRGESLDSVISVTNDQSGLVLDGVPTIVGNLAQQRISGGTLGVTYRVTIRVLTDQGNTLEGEGILQVRNL